MKAIKLILLPLGLISVAIATPFYIGWGVNLGQQMVNSQQTYPASSTTPTQAETNLALTSIGFDLTLGYAPHFTTHWGIDTFLDFTKNYGNNLRKIDNWFSGNSVSVEISTPYSTSFTLALNYYWRPDVNFLIGPTVSQTSFKTTSSTSGGTIGPTGEFSKSLLGTGLTIGADYVVSKNFEVRLTDTYIKSSSVTWTTVEPLSEETLTQKYQLSDNQLQLNFSWFL
jgi:opacity protein-like surface antigen